MYLDSAILVKLVVRESDSVFYADMVDGQIVWSAELALSECFSACCARNAKVPSRLDIARRPGDRWKTISSIAA